MLVQIVVEVNILSLLAVLYVMVIVMVCISSNLAVVLIKRSYEYDYTAKC